MRLSALLLVLAAPLGQWPVGSPTVVEGFSPPDQAWSAGHRGIDLAARTGDPVVSMSAGTVAFAGVLAGKPVVTIAYPGQDHPRSTYEPVVATVAVGQTIAQGQQIGTVAVTGGHCGGALGCLHVGLRTDEGYLDPRSLIERRPAVLKPT